MSKRDSRLLIKDILEAIDRILDYTEEMNFESFESDQKTVDAVVWNFEVIGEATKQISTDFKSNHEEIPWQDLSDFRNRLIHEYFGVESSLWVMLFSIVQTTSSFFNRPDGFPSVTVVLTKAFIIFQPLKLVIAIV